MKRLLVMTMIFVMMGTAACGESEARDTSDDMVNEITVEEIEVEEIETENIVTENITTYDDVTESWD